MVRGKMGMIIKWKRRKGGNGLCGGESGEVMRGLSSAQITLSVPAFTPSNHI